MRTRTRFVLALITALALVGGACGDDGIDLSSLDTGAEEPSPEPSTDATGGSDTGDRAPSDDQDVDPGDDPRTGDEAKQELEAEAKEGGARLSELFRGGVSEAAERCMVDGLVADPDLLAAIVGAGPDPDLSVLSEADQIAAVELGLSCISPEEVSATIQAGFEADVASEALAGDAADCVAVRLTDESDPDRSQLLLGLVALSEERHPSPAQGDLLVELMTECVDPRFMVDAALASVVDDPAIADAVDRGCLDSSIGSAAYMEQFWGLFVANTGAEFEQLPPADQARIVGPFFACVSFGAVVAASAAEDGVTLSAATIACIDDAIRPQELVDAFVGGEPFDEATMAGAILSCLSPEELAAVGG